MQNTNNSNRLKDEKSLYLKQHSHQKIHWFSWGDEALEEAKKRNLPIFLSIGYSSCHWCHVMSKESFDSAQVADFLNENFISIKVDREEHPQIDQYFQKMALHMLGRGGWPLSFFLTPELLPIFCGTYFPLEGRGDHPGFIELCQQVVHRFQNNNDEIVTEGEKLVGQCSELPNVNEEKRIKFPGHYPTPPSILNALEPYKDDANGGYGEAPKFPSFAFYEWAIEQVLESVVPQNFAEHIIQSIEAMSSGGIFDQAKGGIHRYSTDKMWLVPHFEKMLYDQAGLLRILSKTSLVYPSPVILDGIYNTLEYLETEMLSDEGYFFSAQDADSEGVEGLYFCFTEEEFEDAVVRFDESLTDDLETLKKWFGITPLGNFENHLNVLSLNKTYFSDMFQPDNWDKVRKVKKALLIERGKRIPPATDNKGIASWNFLIISALCDVIQYSKIEDFKEKASKLLNKCLEGIHKTFLFVEDNTTKIKHTSTKEETSELLEDYVFFVEAHSRLYELTGKEKFKNNVLSGIKYLVDNFFKDFFYTSSLSETKNSVKNIHHPLFDQSYRSPAATMISILNKWSLIEPDLKKINGYEGFIDKVTQFSLTNPIAFGECLRGLIYPEEAIKHLEIPKAWLKSNDFLRIRANFSNRFLITYAEGDDWQICNSQSCEANGPNMETFLSFLKGNSQEKTEDSEVE